jgi:hypothetical protein
MEEELVTLAQLGPFAAGALVEAMVHDSWDLVKNLFLRLIRRDSGKSDSSTETALEETRRELLAAQGDELEQIVTQREAWWAGRLQALAELDSGYEAALRDFLEEVKQYLPTVDQSQTATQISVRAGRDAFVAGRDQIIKR